MNNMGKMEKGPEYIPRTCIDFSRPDLPWGINISSVCGGYLVQVGCFKKVYPTGTKGITDVVADVRSYMDNPAGANSDKCESWHMLNIAEEAVGMGTVGPSDAPEPPIEAFS